MAQEQLPPEMMAESIPAEMSLPPEIPALPGEEIPMVPGEEVVEEVVEEGIMGGPIQSNALQTDPAKADASATRIVTGAKAQMYGDQFDKFMEVLQNSQNIAEDTAMSSQILLIPEIQAAATTDRGIPIDHMMDVTAEVVSEVLDMATQTGTYAPNSEEEAMRVLNIATTMTMGELGKQLASSQIIPEDDVSQFIENVMGGRYDSPERRRALLDQPEVSQEMPPEMPV